MGYYIWRGGRWQRVRGAEGERVVLVYARGGMLRPAPRALRRLRARRLRRADPLPVYRERKPQQPAPPPVCCHHVVSAHLYSCQQHQQQLTTQPDRAKQPLPSEQQNKQLQNQQQNNQPQSSSETSNQASAACKELMLDYEDVNRIKGYLDKNPQVFGSVDSNLFNEDEVYRSTVLFRFQPLVKINRLPSIEMYYNKTMNLKQFAANLGLKHIDDVERARKHYKTRNNIEKNFSKYFGKHIFSRGSNKENVVRNSKGGSESDSDWEGSFQKPGNGRVVTQREIDNIHNEPKHLRSNVSEMQLTPAVSVRERNGNRPQALMSRKRKRDDDSDQTSAGKQERDSSKAGASKRDNNKKPGRFFTKQDRSNFVRSGRVTKPVSFKSGNGREYSSLEDHAIVAWLHAGGRSRLVNGNRIWRQLQLSYQNITGLARTWQSLRNRYLRHILPALPTLRLSSVMQETLRANAAIGEIKLSRKKSMTRRNSIFKHEQVESAWSRQTRTQGRLRTSEPPADTNTTTGNTPGTSAQDEVPERVMRPRAEPRRRPPSSDEHSSDEFQPKPARLNSNERRNNDIRRLAQRMMRSPRLHNKRSNVPPTADNTPSLNNNHNNTNGRSDKVPVSNKPEANTLKSGDTQMNSPIRTRNSVSNLSKTVTSAPKSTDNESDSPLRSPLRSAVGSPRTVSALSSLTSSVKLFNAGNMRSPRTLGGTLYTSPNKSASPSGKQRLSADKQMAQGGGGGGGGHRRALYNHRAAAL